MWLSSTLAWCIYVFLLKSRRTECYPRMPSRTFQQEGSFANQLLNNQFQAALQQIPPKINDPIPQRRRKPVSVYCHEEAIEVVMNTDLFSSGFPVNAEEVWFGTESSLNKASVASCGAVRTGETELTVLAHLKDCGTKLSVTGDSLVYSNVLIYSPLPSPDGVLHLDGAVIPVQCRYQRWFSVDSAAVAPTWIPFASMVSATDYLDFHLRLMSDDWAHERGSNVYFLGNAIHLQASVTLANHLPLLLFIDWCVATPTPNRANEVLYSFVDNHGCLADSRGLYSHSKFLQRSQGNKLNLLLDAFRFHKVAGNLVYIQCSLKAIPAAYSVSASNRACSFIDGRWQSVDGTDEVCNTCEPSKQSAAEPKPMQPFRITLAPPISQPNLAAKRGAAAFFNVRPGQSLEPFKALIQSRQYPYSGVSKRGTDSNKEWNEIATLGPLFLMPKQEATTQSTGSPQFGPDEVISALVTEKPELLFKSKMKSVTDEQEFNASQETGSFSVSEEGLFRNASDLFDSEEGSGFE